MRLLNTRSYQRGVRLEIVEKWGNDIPQYAIFSHTWSDSEVLIADILNGTFNGRAGFFKLESALLQAKSDGWDWLWADNCCIDKTNSVELSEAINSMFKYYKRDLLCISCRCIYHCVGRRNPKSSMVETRLDTPRTYRPILFAILLSDMGLLRYQERSSRNDQRHHWHRGRVLDWLSDRARQHCKTHGLGSVSGNHTR